MSDYKTYLNPLLQEVEGSSSESYMDHNGNPTVGHGFNLNDQENQAIFKTHGIDPEEVKSGKRSIASDEADSIRNSILSRKERLVRDKVGGEFFDTMKPTQQAALMSLGYQSLNNIGPNLRSRLAEGDDIGAMRELILNTNAEQDPGILKRRLKEAELYGGPLDFSGTFKTFTPEEKQKITDIINKTQNENTKKELLEKYGPYLGVTKEPIKLYKIANLLK